MRLDGWQNFFTLFGTKGDRTTRGTPGFHVQFTQPELDDLYAGGGLARRIIDLPAQDMTREWFTTTDDGSEDLAEYMDALYLQPKVTEALSIGRLFGGALLLMLVDDGRELSEPLNERNVRSIDGFRIYDRWQINWTQKSLYSDPKLAKYGHPESYYVTPYAGGGFNVHESRVIRIPGLAVSERKRVENNGWDYSVLEPVKQALMDLDSSHRASASIIQDFVQTVMSVKGLTDMLSGGQEEAVKKRLDIMDMSRSVLNTLLMDADGESFSKQSSSVSGLSDLLNQFRIQVSSITGIPMTKLFGQSPGGMNATGESDVRNYYDEIATQQSYVLRPILERLVRVCMLSKAGPYGGREPDSWKIQFNPLWQMSDKEVAEVRKLTAETDALYLQWSVFGSDEISEAREGAESWKNPVG